MAMAQAQESLIELTIPRRPEFLRIVRLVVSGYLSRLDISFDEVENMKVAVSEACNSAMQFDNVRADDAICIRCWHENSDIIFQVRAPGAADTSETTEDDEAGLGFLLIQTLMDEVSGDADPHTGTTVTMKKSLGS